MLNDQYIVGGVALGEAKLSPSAEKGMGVNAGEN